MRPSGRKAMRQGRSNCALLLPLKGGEAVAGRVPALIGANTGVAAMSNGGMSPDFGNRMLCSAVGDGTVSAHHRRTAECTAEFRAICAASLKLRPAAFSLAHPADAGMPRR